MAKRILIVEDDLMIARNLERMLMKHGYEVPSIAIDYDQAHFALKHQSFDLALLDVNLSGSKGGIDVAALINKDYRFPFFYITSYTDQKTIDELKVTQPAGYISKPVQTATLTTNIDLLFNRPSSDSKEVIIHIGTSVHKYYLDQIRYAQADHVYTELFHSDGSDVLRISLQALQDQFPENELIRVNRSVAVNRRAISKIDRTTVCIKDNCFKMSKNLVEDIWELLK